MNRPASRRTVLAAALAATAGAVAVPTALASANTTGHRPTGHHHPRESFVDFRAWRSKADWAKGEGKGVKAAKGARPGIVIGKSQGTVEYTDPHTKKKAEWEYASWTSPSYSPSVPASQLIASWNAHTPAGTWIRVEAQGTYTDGATTPWYTLGVWTSGDGDDVVRRTSVDDQSDDKSSVGTDTLAIDDPASGVRLTGYQLRVTLYRTPKSDATPTVWRLGAMSSDVPDRFEVPASKPGPAAGVELKVPRYSQNVHEGQYPEYDGGGEAWCSPTSSQMILEYWGRKPTKKDLEWVNPDYADPQVCHAARHTFDYQYEGCGNWPFNAAYAATYKDMQAAVTRLDSLHEIELLVAAGIPVITSQSFLESELDGAGYGTAGHLMTVIGFTKKGDVIANDPASPDNPSVRHVYKRRQFENIWLRTKRKNDEGEVVGGSGGVVYVYFPTELKAGQAKVLKRLGLL
ncbi:peptidase C39 family protein [Streptomyces sp. NPDC005438]|uniref:peptidase C39 family protein n=1 Tax=Streptomyces sp. NPDC005438 TaxID=3156880 RepID=UPI0033BED5A1